MFHFLCLNKLLNRQSIHWWFETWLLPCDFTVLQYLESWYPVSTLRPSFQIWYIRYKDLYNGNPFIGKTIYLHWDGPQITRIHKEWNHESICCTWDMSWVYRDCILTPTEKWDCRQFQFCRIRTSARDPRSMFMGVQGNEVFGTISDNTIFLTSRHWDGTEVENTST